MLIIGYYKTSHLFLGTQKGFSHPQQFPMIPTIWLINIWLVHYWFMDNWPGWKMVPKTAEETARDYEVEKAFLQDVRWNPSFGWGLGVGVLSGIAIYFVIVLLLPVFYNAINIIK